MNLVDDPWLPVLADGHIREVSLLDALTHPRQYAALSPETPTMIPALLRQVLLAVTLAASGPPGSLDEWRERFDADTGDAAAVDYLHQHHDRFELFDGPRPFAQVADLHTATGETKSSSLLVPAAATGNNVPLFSVHTEAHPPVLTAAEALRWLLHAHCWDTAAIKTGAVDDPQVRAGKTTGNPTGPLGQLGVVVPLGRDLHETIVLNTPIVPDGLDPLDKPQWMRTHGPQWQARPARGHLDLLTWQARRIRLVPGPDNRSVSQVILAAGDRLMLVPDYEPHTAWTRVEKAKPGERQWRPRRHISGRSAWQGMAALLEVVPDAASRWRSSLLLRQVHELQRSRRLPRDYPLNVLTTGIEYGNQSAVVENVISDTIPVPVAALRAEPATRVFLDRVVEQTEELTHAVNDLHTELRRAAGGDPVPWDKSQRPGDSVVQQVNPVIRRLLTGLQAHPDDDQLDQAQIAWEQTARGIGWQVAEALLADAPPETFAGRHDRNARPHRAALAEQRFRARLNDSFPRTRAAARRP